MHIYHRNLVNYALADAHRGQKGLHRLARFVGVRGVQKRWRAQTVINRLVVALRAWP